MRGNLLSKTRLGRWLCKRSIPAGAGEPACLMASKAFNMVYPRGCGGTEVPHGKHVYF